MWEVSWRLNRTATYWPPTLMDITAFISFSPGLLNRGPGGPASLGHGPHSSIFSPTNSNNLCPELYYCFYTHSIQPVDSQGYPLETFDRMHLLFTQVNFLFWQLGQGHYAICHYSRLVDNFISVIFLTGWVCHGSGCLRPLLNLFRNLPRTAQNLVTCFLI